MSDRRSFVRRITLATAALAIGDRIYSREPRRVWTPTDEEGLAEAMGVAHLGDSILIENDLAVQVGRHHFGRLARTNDKAVVFHGFTDLGWSRRNRERSTGRSMPSYIEPSGMFHKRMDTPDCPKELDIWGNMRLYNANFPSYRVTEDDLPAVLIKRYQLSGERDAVELVKPGRHLPPRGEYVYIGAVTR